MTIYTVVDNLCRCILVDSIMQLILNGGEKHLSHLITRVIVRGGSINVCDLLIEVTLAATNIPNAL